jgi:hypothetical protein
LFEPKFEAIFEAIFGAIIDFSNFWKFLMKYQRWDGREKQK